VVGEFLRERAEAKQAGTVYPTGKES
jgi:hypothetical protein